MRATKYVEGRLEKTRAPSGLGATFRRRRQRRLLAGKSCWIVRQQKTLLLGGETFQRPSEDNWRQGFFRRRTASRKNAAPPKDAGAACRRCQRTRCSRNL